jgi:hypothetical protein
MFPSLVKRWSVGNEMLRILAVSFLDFKSLSGDLGGFINLIVLSKALLNAFSKSDNSCWMLNLPLFYCI